MTSFDARLRLQGRIGFPLGVVVDLTEQSLRVRAGEKELANWTLDEIRIASEADGYHIVAEGEEVILNVTDSARFAVELGAIDFLRRSG